MSRHLLEVRDLRVHYRRQHRKVKAVDGISFTLAPGETMGLVGESGCGKSSTVRAVLRLLKPTSGTITFEGTDLTHLSPKQLRPHRRQIQAVFQDPYGSLNPRMTVDQIISQPLRIHGLEARDRVDDLLDLVGLGSEHARRFPRELSGGQRQRVGIARALALSPRLVVLDEPVSSLDVSIRAQILNLLKEIQDRLGVAYLLVSHDLSVVRHLSDHVAVMYLGRTVQAGTRGAVFGRSAHPYTRSLLSAVPTVARSRSERIVLTGEVPDPAAPPPGCHFSPRCFQSAEACFDLEPALANYSDSGRCACHFPLPAPPLGSAGPDRHQRTI